jgi:formiminoglutamase
MKQLVIKIPSSQGGLGKADGSELAPDKIQEQLKDLFAAEDGTEKEFEFDNVNIIDSNIEETNKNIYEKAKQVLSKKPIFIGGDHSITYSLVRAFSEEFKGQNNGIIIFDAHPDAENDFMPPTQEDLLPAMVKQDMIKPQNIILVGTRNWDKKEIEFLEQNKIKYFNMDEISEKGIKQISEELNKIVKTFDNLYISIDIDVLDPAFAPGTGYIEPAGLTTRESLYILQSIKQLNNIKSIDIMEINPKKDVNNMTSKVGAKLLVELAYY